MAEWSARRTRNPALPGSSPALAGSWICSRSSRVQILSFYYKQAFTLFDLLSKFGRPELKIKKTFID